MEALQIAKKIALICGIFSTGFNGIAQKHVEHQNLLWTRYQLHINIDAHWSASQQLEERTYWFPWRQHQFVSRTMARYRFKNGFGIGGGFAYFLQSLPQDPDQSVNYTQPEIRPTFEIAYLHPLSQKLNLNHRYGAEWRYFKPENEELAFGNYRMRYKLELQYQPTQKITLKTYDEIFINLGNNIVNNTFDQNRIGASVQYMPWNNFGFELGYINWFQQRPSGVDFYNRNIVRFTIHQTIDLRTSKK